MTFIIENTKLENEKDQLVHIEKNFIMELRKMIKRKIFFEKINHHQKHHKTRNNTNLNLGLPKLASFVKNPQSNNPKKT